MKALFHFLFYILCMLVMLSILHFGEAYLVSFSMPLIYLGIILIIGGAILGLFTESILKFSLLSCVVQLGYLITDAGSALLVGKSIMFASIQFVSFGLTGLLFAFILCKLHSNVKNSKIKEFGGFFNKNNVTIIGLVICALAFGGMPGFNIFVGEYLIYGLLFSINPILTMITIFGSLLAFIFYFRLVFIVLSGKNKKIILSGIIGKAIIIILGFLTVFLGIVPWILFGIVSV